MASIVDYINSQGGDSSYSARKDLAKSLGITNYSGTAEQNTQMLNMLKSGNASASSNKATGTASAQGSPINGVSAGTYNTMQSSFNASSTVKKAQKEANKYLDKVKEMSNVTDIIDQSTWDAINNPFTSSDAYKEAMDYTNSLLQQLSTGRTSYTDQIKDLMSDIQNREDFEYDVDADPLFQQALSSAMSSGQTAMQDTIGQASALTGGYGSTYATSAGNQAYNAYIQDAYNNLPEYYQMALEAYQMEGEEMYRQLGMLQDADATEYQRTFDSWNANFANAQSMYEKEYGQWQDSVNNAYNSANLQLSEYGQLFEQAYNAYNAVQNNASTLYQQEYQKWAGEVANAFSLASLGNSDYWNTTNYNETVRQFNEQMAQRQKEHNAEMGYKYSALAQDQAQFETSHSAKVSGGSGSGDSGLKEPSETQMSKALESYNSGGMQALNQYINSLPSTVDKDLIAEYVGSYGTYDTADNPIPLEQRTFTKVKDTYNYFGGTDNNDVVRDQYGNEFKIKELPESLRAQLTSLGIGKTYNQK
jgi:hypothetical protein